MRMAYADPPYLGCCQLYLHDHGDDGRCWNEVDTHRRLIARLATDFPDGWALSASSPSLRQLLPLCPEDVRVSVWCKTFSAFKKGVRPAYAWEPLVFRGGRNQNPPTPPKGGEAITPKDFVIANMTLRKGTVGVKPPEFCWWVFDLLGLAEGDELSDVFPGSGAVTEALNAYLGQLPTTPGTLFAEAAS